MDCVYLNASIQAYHSARPPQTLFDGGDGVLGSEICPDYKKRLIIPGGMAGLGSG